MVRTLKYSLPDDVYSHVELIQPTTMFTRMKALKATPHFSVDQSQTAAAATGSSIKLPSGVTVDASCNTTITVTCLKELYNAVGYKTSATNGNTFGITGYLDQFANIADLQLFYADQRPDALGSSFELISVNGSL